MIKRKDPGYEVSWINCNTDGRWNYRKFKTLGKALKFVQQLEVLGRITTVHIEDRDQDN